jgi:hypothetical protein
MPQYEFYCHACSTKLPRRRKRRTMTPKESRQKRNMGEVIADARVEEAVEAVDFAAPHNFGERPR